MNPLSENLFRRLNLSKYLFRQAQRVRQVSGAYSRGLATSLLHDAVEVFLRVLVERFRIPIRQQEGFNQLFEKVRKQLDFVGEHSAAMKRLNTARVGFKHEGLDVSATDVASFLANVESFLSEVCEQVLRIDFATLSLVSAIGHRRTENWLNRAREALLSERYTESVAHSAAALAIYLGHRDTKRGEQVDPSYYIDYGSKELGNVADWVIEYVEPIRIRLDLVSRGIHAPSYDKFEALTPVTSVGRRGGVSQYAPKAAIERSREDARYCYDFAVDSILALRDIEVPPTQIAGNSAVARVIAPCELVVHPDHKPPEVIRLAELSEKLQIAPQQNRTIYPPDRSEYLQVLQDGDVVYVRRDCIEECAHASELHS